MINIGTQNQALYGRKLMTVPFINKVSKVNVQGRRIQFLIIYGSLYVI